VRFTLNTFAATPRALQLKLTSSRPARFSICAVSFDGLAGDGSVAQVVASGQSAACLRHRPPHDVAENVERVGRALAGRASPAEAKSMPSVRTPNDR
jgi:hypothetical protein